MSTLKLGCKTCSVCGKALSNVQIWAGQKYCSRKCYYKTRTGIVINTGNYDTSFLTVDNQFRAYFLGIFVTDGTFLTREKVRITLCDQEIIEYIANRTNYKLPILVYRDNPKHKYAYSITFCGQVKIDLKNIGYFPGPKTGKEFIPKCVENTPMFFHFLRGTIDGDGSILEHSSAGTLVVKLCSANKTFLEAIHTKLQILDVVRGGGICKTSTIYSLCYGHEDSVSLCNKLYANADFALIRKKNIYLKLKDLQLKKYSQKKLVCCIDGCTAPAFVKGYCQHHYYQRNEHVSFKKEYYIRNKERILKQQKAFRASK